MDEWLPEIMENSSIKSLLLSTPSSFAADARGVLDDDDRDEIERFQVMTFVTCWVNST